MAFDHGDWHIGNANAPARVNPPAADTVPHEPAGGRMSTDVTGTVNSVRVRQEQDKLTQTEEATERGTERTADNHIIGSVD